MRAANIPARLFAAVSLLAATACGDSTAPKLDSHAILYQIQNALYTINPDGTGERRITDGTHFDGFGAWSPDGTRIAFTSSRGGTDQLYTMRADGSDAKPVSILPSNPTNPPQPFLLSWSSKNVLAYLDGGGLKTIPLAGGTPYTLQTGQVLVNADWSPDGTRIAFTSTRAGNSHIFVINADGTNLIEITSGAATGDGAPAWSPDGRRIAYGGSGIWVVNADGSNNVQLTTVSTDFWPAWSPDGTRIAFASERDGPGDLYVMNADGSNLQRLTTTGVYRTGVKWRRTQ